MDEIRNLHRPVVAREPSLPTFPTVEVRPVIPNPAEEGIFRPDQGRIESSLPITHSSRLFAAHINPLKIDKFPVLERHISEMGKVEFPLTKGVTRFIPDLKHP